MDFAFFESLTPEDAQTFLQNFLDVESSAAESLLTSLPEDAQIERYSIDSVAPILRSLIANLNAVEKTPDEDIPIWVRNCPSYARGLFEFDDPSKALVLRGAFYFGESFVRSYSCLSWQTGNPDTAEQNMPVVSGFRSLLEMAPMLVVDNLFRRIIADHAEPEVFDAAVSYWKSKAR